MFEQELTFASRALGKGNLAASEIVCRDVLDKESRNPTALSLLGTIAERIGSPDRAAVYFEAVLAIEPNNVDARANLNRVKALSCRTSQGASCGPRYLMVKSWGFGFWSDVSHVLGALLLGEVTGRVPVIHWGKNSLFSDDPAKDAFATFFEPVSCIKLNDLEALPRATFFPPKWNAANLKQENVAKWKGDYSRAAALYFLNRPEIVAVSDFHVGVVDVAPWIPEDHPMHGKPLPQIYRYVIDKYLRPRAPALSACEAFYTAHLQGRPYAAVHIRGSDKAFEDKNLEANSQKLLSAVAALDPNCTIFLLTDDTHWHERMTLQFGSRVVATKSQRSSNATGVHYLKSLDRIQIGFEVLVDTLLALRADRFVGNGSSNVSAMIAVMKEWPRGACTLIGESSLLKRNLFIHLRQ
jgi:protein O-GlcNAc transferase